MGEAPPEPPCRIDRLGSIDVLRHEVDTRGIADATRYFDMECIAAEEVPYASVLAMVLGRLDTAKHTAALIDTLVQGRLGALDFACEVFDVTAEDAGERGWTAKFTVGSSALSENVQVAAEALRTRCFPRPTSPTPAGSSTCWCSARCPWSSASPWRATPSRPPVRRRTPSRRRL